MDPDQLESAAEREESKAKHAFAEADKAKAEAERIRSEIDKLRLTEDANVEIIRKEALKHPDNELYWVEKAGLEQSQLDQNIERMERHAKEQEELAAKKEAEAQADHQKAEELQEKKRQRQAVLLMVDMSQDEDARNAA